MILSGEQWHSMKPCSWLNLKITNVPDRIRKYKVTWVHIAPCKIVLIVFIVILLSDVCPLCPCKACVNATSCVVLTAIPNLPDARSHQNPSGWPLSPRIIDRSYPPCWLPKDLLNLNWPVKNFPLVEFLRLGAAGTVDHKHNGVSMALSLALASDL